MATGVEETDQLLTPAEVAALFRVDPKTVTRWAKAGKLTSVRTLGGHRRYLRDEVKALLARTTTVPRESASPRYEVPAQQTPSTPPPGGGLAPLPPPPPTPGSSGGLPASS